MPEYAREEMLTEARDSASFHCTHLLVVELVRCKCMYVTVCCSVLQLVAACCSVLQCVAVCCSSLYFHRMR